MMTMLYITAGAVCCFLVLAMMGRRLRKRTGPYAKAPIKEQVHVTLNHAPEEE